MAPIKTVVFFSSCRPDRMNDRVVKLIDSRLKFHAHIVNLIDPLEWNLPLLTIPIHYYPSRKDAPQILINLNKIVEDSDQLLFATTEYNRCLPPALSNIIDYLPHASFAFKPFGIVSYSIRKGGGQVSASQLRLLCNALGSIPVPFSIALDNIDKHITEDGFAINQNLNDEIDLIIEQLDYITKGTQLIKSHSNLRLPKVRPNL